MQLVSGVACILCGLLQGQTDPGLQALQILLSLVGKFGASASFAIVYVYTVSNNVEHFCTFYINSY